MDADPGAVGPRKKLGPIVNVWVTRFEAMLHGIAFLLLVAAAVLVLIGSVEAIAHAVTARMNALETGVLVLDRILLILIIAELASTLRTVLERHEITVEPFLFIGLIAAVRRILIVTAEFEQPQEDGELVRLLLELGTLALLVLSMAAAIVMIRHSAAKAASSASGAER
jgi:uncharacterized membrane protein (DUF373 family)